MTSMNTKKLLLGVFFIFLLFATPSWAQRAYHPAKKDTLRFGFSLGPFNDVNLKDARIALDMLTREIVNQLSVRYFPVMTIYRNQKKLISDIENNKIDMVVISSIDYLQNENKLKIDPALVGVSNKVVGVKFDLLVRKDSKIKKIEQLRGRTIAIPKSNDTDRLFRLWLKSLLHSAGIYNAKKFEELVEVEDRPSATILKVFFGQKTACIVDDQSYRVSVELNPQISQELTILRQSPKYLSTFFAFRKDMNKKTRHLVFEKSLKLDSYPEGKQILTLFKMDKLVPCYPRYLNSVRQLLQDTKNIK